MARARFAMLLAVLGWAGLATGCVAAARECAGGLYCPPEMVCVASVGCCADPAWLKEVDGGMAAIMASPDGAVFLGGEDPETGEALPPLCGKAAK